MCTFEKDTNVLVLFHCSNLKHATTNVDAISYMLLFSWMKQRISPFYIASTRFPIQKSLKTMQVIHQKLYMDFKFQKKLLAETPIYVMFQFHTQSKFDI